MILKFLRKLGAGSSTDSSTQPHTDPIEYGGFQITPNPQKVAGGWSTQGVISKSVEGEDKSQVFVRSDTLSSKDEAVQFSIEKGKRIIDEQGERLFRERP